MAKPIQVEEFSAWLRKRRMPGSVPHADRRSEVIKLMEKAAGVEAGSELPIGSHFPVQSMLKREASKPTASAAARERYEFLSAAREAWYGLCNASQAPALRGAPRSARPSRVSAAPVQASAELVQ